MKTIIKLFVGFGIFLLIGTAGASDMNSIEVSQILRQLAISILIISSGLLSLKAIEISENKKRRARRLKKMCSGDIMNSAKFA